MLFIATYSHRHGIDSYLFRCDNPEKVTVWDIVKTFDLDFEPEREEWISWDAYNEEDIATLKVHDVSGDQTHG